MRKVLEQTQALAEAILRSDVYTALADARAAVDGDSEAAQLVAACQTAQDELQRLLRQGAQADPAALSASQKVLNAAQAAMDSHPLVARFAQRRQAFDEMMDSVNQVLRLRINGVEDIPQTQDAPCGGCGRCCGKGSV